MAEQERSELLRMGEGLKQSLDTIAQLLARLIDSIPKFQTDATAAASATNLFGDTQAGGSQQAAIPRASPLAEPSDLGDFGTLQKSADFDFPVLTTDTPPAISPTAEGLAFPATPPTNLPAQEAEPFVRIPDDLGLPILPQIPVTPDAQFHLQTYTDEFQPQLNQIYEDPTLMRGTNDMHQAAERNYREKQMRYQEEMTRTIIDHDYRIERMLDALKSRR